MVVPCTSDWFRRCRLTDEITACQFEPFLWVVFVIEALDATLIHLSSTDQWFVPGESQGVLR